MTFTKHKPCRKYFHFCFTVEKKNEKVHSKNYGQFIGGYGTFYFYFTTSIFFWFSSNSQIFAYYFQCHIIRQKSYKIVSIMKRKKFDYVCLNPNTRRNTNTIIFSRKSIPLFYRKELRCLASFFWHFSIVFTTSLIGTIISFRCEVPNELNIYEDCMIHYYIWNCEFQF